jgi:hypothetical protein
MEFPSSLRASAPHAQNIVASLSPKEFFIRPEVLAAVSYILQNPDKWSDPRFDAIAKDIMDMMILINDEKITHLTIECIQHAYDNQWERIDRERQANIARQLEATRFDHWSTPC